MSKKTSFVKFEKDLTARLTDRKMTNAQYRVFYNVYEMRLSPEKDDYCIGLVKLSNAVHKTVKRLKL